MTPTNTRISEILDDILISTYENGMLHGEAQANGVLATPTQRLMCIEHNKARLSQLLADEVSRARKDEVKRIWGHAREHTITDIEMIMHQTQGKVDFIEAVDTKHLEARLSELERKESKDE